MAGLVIMALGVTGCAASASTGSSKPAGVTSHGTTAAARTSGTATAAPGLGGLTSNGPAGPAQWVVDGTFETRPACQTLSDCWGGGTFRDTANGRTVQVTVGDVRKFSLAWSPGPTPLRDRPSTATRNARHR